MDSATALAAALGRYNDLIYAQVRRVLDEHASRQHAPPDFYNVMRYQFGWVNERLERVVVEGGKGLRGGLLMLVNAACGGDETMAAPLAAAVELLHNFSLIHDDIVDASPTRRHRPAIWALWGTPLGINAGDALFALAHLALFDSSLRRKAPARFIAIAQHFDEAILRICEGQHHDMAFERATDVPVDAYLAMIGGKTATLIAATSWIGACAAGAAQDRVAAAFRFGYDLGMAFQMQDDILGIWGDEAVTGKSASSDIASRKKTLPVLLAMADTTSDAAARLRSLYTQPTQDPTSTQEILALLDGAGARELARAYLRRYCEASEQALREMQLPASEQERLELFARRFIERVA